MAAERWLEAFDARWVAEVSRLLIPLDVQVVTVGDPFVVAIEESASGDIGALELAAVWPTRMPPKEEPDEDLGAKLDCCLGFCCFGRPDCGLVATAAGLSALTLGNGSRLAIAISGWRLPADEATAAEGCDELDGL